jgi:hypothetical protein
MRKIREILRLRADGFSEREISRSVGCARSSIQICLWRADQGGISWPLSAEQDDAALEQLLYPRRPPGIEVHPAPDYAWVGVPSFLLPKVMAWTPLLLTASVVPKWKCQAAT